MGRSPAPQFRRGRDAVSQVWRSTDTSESAQWGYSGYDEETELPSREYGVARAAAVALTEMAPWEAETRAAVALFLGSEKVPLLSNRLDRAEIALRGTQNDGALHAGDREHGETSCSRRRHSVALE